jgi:hypothetical protein
MLEATSAVPFLRRRGRRLLMWCNRHTFSSRPSPISHEPYQSSSNGITSVQPLKQRLVFFRRAQKFFYPGQDYSMVGCSPYKVEHVNTTRRMCP